MIEINRYKLCPGVEVSAHWGEITGDITDQSDLIAYINEHGGSDAVWGSITGDIADQSDLTGYVSTALSGYATEDWVTAQSYLVESDLSQYATRQWVTGRGYITSSDLSGYATEDYVTTALSGYATQSWVGEQGYITSSALSGYATVDWVTAQSYLTSSSLKTVNNQSLVGSGDIEIGGLTPEQEEAIEPLEDPSDGVLYTLGLKVNKEQFIQSSVASGEWNSQIYNVDGDVYIHRWNDVYKWNPDTFVFDERFYVADFNYTYPLWKDNTGRMYCGPQYEIDLENGTCTAIDLKCSDYGFSGNRQSIWKGRYGIYSLMSGQKFDETAQEFVNWTFDVETGYDLRSIGDSFAFGLWYDGHYVCYNGSVMFELLEYEDHVEYVAVADPYFPNTALDWDGTTPMTLYNGYFHNVSGELFYLQSGNSFKFEDGEWVRFESTSEFGGVTWNYSVGRGVIYGDYLIGFDSNSREGFYDIITITEPVTKTYWSPIKNVALDLVSDQNVIGTKSFNNISTLLISNLNQIYTTNKNLFYLNNNVTNAKSIKLTVDGSCTLNNSPVATMDDCICNKTVIPYGDTYVDVLNTNGYQDPYYYNYWTTHTGRLFYSASYEFDGTQFNQVTIPAFGGIYGPYVKRTSNNTFFCDGNDTYLWDDANSDFVLIASNTPGNGRWEVWPCGDTLRYSDSYKLVNNGGTWSWESDPLSDYKYGMTYVVNGNVYVLSLNDNCVYQYDELTKTYTLLGHYHNWSDYSFAACGEIFNLWNGDAWYRIDFTKVGGSDDYIDVVTSIPVAGDYSYFYGEYGGYVHFFRQYSTFSYCYSEQYDLPEVPATNGTYVLQATRVGDEVTYEWVSNVI